MYHLSFKMSFYGDKWFVSLACEKSRSSLDLGKRRDAAIRAPKKRQAALHV